MCSADGTVADCCLLTDNNIKPPGPGAAGSHTRFPAAAEPLWADYGLMETSPATRQNPILRIPPLPDCFLSQPDFTPAKCSSAFSQSQVWNSPSGGSSRGKAPTQGCGYGACARPLRKACGGRLAPTPSGTDGSHYGPLRACFMSRLDSKYLLEMCRLAPSCSDAAHKRFLCVRGL